MSAVTMTPFAKWPCTLLVAAAAGCAVAPPPVPEPKPAVVAVPVPAPTPDQQFFATLERLRSIDQVTLAAETDQARRKAARAPSDFTRLEAALALFLSPGENEAEIIALLTPVLSDSARVQSQSRTLAGFLLVLASERLKLKEGAADASAKAREHSREAQSQRQRADAQKERADLLQQKLDALSDLEKSFTKRPNAAEPDQRPR